MKPIDKFMKHILKSITNITTIFAIEKCNNKIDVKIHSYMFLYVINS